MSSVSDFFVLDDKYCKVVGSLLSEANLRSDRTRSGEQVLALLIGETDSGTRLLLLESVISSQMVLPAVGAVGEMLTECLRSDANINAMLNDWTSSEVLNAGVSSFLQVNADVVDVHYSSVERIVTELKESAASSLVGSAFEFRSLQPFGSSVSQLCVAGSCDIDVVLCVMNSAGSAAEVTSLAERESEENREDSCDVLALVKDGLIKGTAFEVKELVTRARVPVLKLRHLESQTEIDVVVNRTNGLENTALLVKYLSIDERVGPLIIAIKHWAKCRGICNARNSTLSSYGWSLLALHFLQHTSPPVLPSALVIGEDPVGTSDVSANTDTVGALLVKFFAYYGLPHATHQVEGLLSDSKLCFNLFCQVITLDGDRTRTKGTVAAVAEETEDSSTVPPTAGAAGLPVAPWWRLSIQDPIDSTFDVGRVIHSYEGQVLILNEMRRALDYLLKLQPGTDGEHRNPYQALCEINLNIPDLIMKCHICDESDHLSAECPNVRCVHCTSRDHASRHCPNKICFRCRGYHVKALCPLLTAPPAGTASSTAGGRATSIIPRSLMLRTAVEEDDEEWLDEESETRNANPSRMGAGRDGDGFIQEVLGWTAADFMNDKLIHPQLHPIPLEFESSTAWYRTFYPFLLEEMRSQVQKTVDGSFHMTPRTAVKFYHSHKVDDVTFMSTIPAYMILPTGLDEAKFEEACTCTVGLLVNSAKGAHRDITADSLAKMLHLLVRIEFRLKPDGYRLSKEEQDLLRENPGCIIFNIALPNNPTAMELLFTPLTKKTPQWELLAINVGTYSSIRTCNALAQQETPRLIMNDVVTGQNVCAAVSAQSRTTLPLRGADSIDISNEFTASLNESQRNAVTQVLEVGSALGISTIQIVKGPPGTGKTATLVALLQSLMKCNLRIHACAPTNVAVCELARRCLSAFMTAVANGTALKGKRLADFLLIGVRKRLKVKKAEEGEDVLQSILFDDRVDRLRIAGDSVREHSMLLLGALRQYTSFLAEEEDALLSDPSSNLYQTEEIDPAQQLHVKITTSAEKLHAGLHILSQEAPSGALRGVSSKDLQQLLCGLAVLQSLSEEVFRKWKGLRTVTAATTETEEGRVHDAFVKVNRKLTNVVVVTEKLKKLEVVQAASLVFSTVNVGGREIFRLVHFDVVVIDEATQLLQGETAIVLRRGLRCLVLAGDDMQLPATVMSAKCKKLGYDESLFSRLIKLEYPFVLLNVQYRMHPAISRWPRMQFYGGDVLDGPNVLSDSYAKEWHSTFPPLSVYNLTAGGEELHEHGSKYNEAEAVLVRRIVAEIRGLKTPLTVGIISPYSAQIVMLDHLLTFAAPASTTTNATATSVGVRVNTVDSFQGQECDIIIFSTVRANDQGNIGFLQDTRRLNVAVTRAKFALVVICSVRTLSNHPVWLSLFEHARREDCLFSAETHQVIKLAAKKFEKGENRMKALLKQTDMFELAPWKIVFSGDVKVSIAQLSEKMRLKTFKTCLGLAHGEWPKFEFVANEVPAAFQEILHVHRVLQYRLVWSVDVDRSTFEQCLRIWNVVLESDVGQAVRRAVTVLSTYSTEYLSRCAAKQCLGSSSRGATASHAPAKWTPDKDFIWLASKELVAAGATHARELSLERTSVGSSAVLTKFFALTSSVVRMFTSSNSFASIELPFVMSSTEEEIVRHEGSVFILGRSGTGKTTVILHRMFLHRKHDQLLKSGGDTDDASVCKQLLVTASPILCEAIRRSYNSMVQTSELLAVSGDKGAAPDLTAAKNSPAEGAQNDETGDEALPLTFEACQLKDFPLIVTYMSFLRMLDASLECPFFPAEGAAGKEVDFLRFCTHYYPHFSTEVSKQADAALIYTEVMSHIKGSLAALHCDGGCLSREDYLALSDSRTSTLSTDQRALLYEVFIKYEKLKTQMYPGDFDVLDVVYHVYRALHVHGRTSYRPERIMTTVSVDEVQDLVPAQIVLFKFVCPNPAGFVFAGDTAQTIAHGVGFRFETLKDIFYHEFVPGFTHTEVEEEKAALVPKVWHLSENFRTHTGVVSIANSVVELVTYFFPHSIDKLDPECSRVMGPAPIFIDGEGDLVMSLFQNNTLGSSCEFGAEQVILVRDEATKQRVLDVSGNRALVLTVLESKGMEFTDCLIYNFFGSSPLTNEWRVLYDLVAPSEPHPAFDAHKYSALCVELKFLYVLLTRARQHVIIFDSDVKSREPMLRYWLQNALVERKPLDEDIRNLFLTASKPEEWQERGKQFYDRKQYANARLCFQRAGDHFQERLCNAAELEQNGDSAVVSTPLDARKLYRQAADEYLALAGYTLSAARCFESAEEFVVAAEHFTAVSRHRDAGRCFERAVMWSEAAHSYEKINDVENALRCCYTPRDYESGRFMLDGFLAKQVISEAEHGVRIEECAKKAAIHFHSKGKRAKMLEYVHLFRDTESKRNFLRRYKHFDLLLDIEIHDHCYASAACIYEDMYDFTKAKQFFQEAFMPAEVVRCALKIVRLDRLDERYMITSLDAEHQQLLDEAKATAVEATLSGNNMHIRTVDLLLLYFRKAGPDKDESLVAELTKLSEGALKMGIETAWTVQFSTLQYLLRTLLAPTASTKASIATKNKNGKQTTTTPAAPATVGSGLSTADCEASAAACLTLRQLVEHVTPALTAVSTQQHTHLSSSQHRILQQCVDFFEFKAVTHLTASSEVQCLRSVKGLATVFGVPPLPSAALGVLVSRTAKMSIKEFCQHALKYFRSELMRWLQQCAEACEQALSAMPSVWTFAGRAANQLKSIKDRVVPEPATKQRFQLLCCLHDCLASLTSLQAGTNETQSVARTREAQQRFVESRLMNILLPTEPLLEDMSAVSLLRSQQQQRVSQLVAQLHNTQQFRQPGLKCDLFARALLAAELSGTTSATAQRLRTVMATELRNRRTPLSARHTYVLSALVEGFAWENVSNTALPTPTWTLGTFFYGIQSLANGLLVDVEKGGGGVNAIMYGNEISEKFGCFAPSTFVKLMQKCFVLLLLHWKNFSDIILPTTLASDVLARRNPSYARAIEEYATSGFKSTSVAKDRSWAARQQVTQLVSKLFYLLEFVSPAKFLQWHKYESDYVEVSARDSAEKKKEHEVGVKNAQDSFCNSTLQLILLFLVNCSTDDYSREKNCMRVVKLVNSPNGPSIVRMVPLYLSNLLSKLTHKELNRSMGLFQRSTGDPLLLVHCQHTCAVKMHVRFLSLLPTRRILEVGPDGSIQLVPHLPPIVDTPTFAEEEEEVTESKASAKAEPAEGEATEQVTVAAPHEQSQEERLEPFYTRLRRLAQQARARVHSLSPVTALMRHVEREFVHAFMGRTQVGNEEGVSWDHLRRWSPAVTRYKNELCPLYVEIQLCSEGLQKAIKTMEAQAAPDMEKMDPMLDADEALQKCLTEMLSNLSTVLPTVTDLDAHINSLKQRGELQLQSVRDNKVMMAEVARVTTGGKAAPTAARVAAGITSKVVTMSQSKRK